jgi:hypothetical protein
VITCACSGRCGGEPVFPFDCFIVGKVCTVEHHGESENITVKMSEAYRAQSRAILVQQCGTQISMTEFASDWLAADHENPREARLRALPDDRIAAGRFVATQPEPKYLTDAARLAWLPLAAAFVLGLAILLM